MEFNCITKIKKINTKYMRKIRTDRLRIVADHLINGKLGHETFDFTMINNSYTGAFTPNKCGTNGCAVGELPIIFPKDWFFADFNGYPRLTDSPKSGTWDDVDHFFSIEDKESEHLFIPRSQNINEYGGKRLHGNASKEEVANNIIEFCRLMEERGLHYVGE